jgi:hypothetical protein
MGVGINTVSPLSFFPTPTVSKKWIDRRPRRRRCGPPIPCRRPRLCPSPHPPATSCSAPEPEPPPPRRRAAALPSDVDDDPARRRRPCARRAAASPRSAPSEPTPHRGDPAAAPPHRSPPRAGEHRTAGWLPAKKIRKIVKNFFKKNS